MDSFAITLAQSCTDLGAAQATPIAHGWDQPAGKTFWARMTVLAVP